MLLNIVPNGSARNNSVFESVFIRIYLIYNIHIFQNIVFCTAVHCTSSGSPEKLSGAWHFPVKPLCSLSGPQTLILACRQPGLLPFPPVRMTHYMPYFYSTSLFEISVIILIPIFFISSVALKSLHISG